MSQRDLITYVLGKTWTEKERILLAPFVEAINSAAAGKYIKCERNAAASIEMLSSSISGYGKFAKEKISSGTAIGIYIGSLEVKCRYDKGGFRHDYVMALPDIILPTGRSFKVVVCGYEERLDLSSASTLNNACERFNSMFFLDDVHYFSNMEMRLRVAAMESNPDEKSKITKRMRSEAQEISFSYVVVIAVTTRDVQIGEELLTPYNRPGKKITSDSYLTSKAFADAKCKPHEIVLPCMCGVDGICPKSMYFIRPRDDVVAGAPLP